MDAADPDPSPRSPLTGIVWPAFLDEAAARLLALQFQLMQSQWWPAERILAHQQRQLAGLLRHAAATVPWYRERLPAGLVGGDGAIDWQRWVAVPVLTREAVQQAGAALLSAAVPPEHGAPVTVRTSGSTGRAVEVQAPVVTGLFWQAITLREHLWQRRDLGGKLAAIRSYHDPGRVPPGGVRQAGWGPATDLIYDTGVSAAFDIHVDIAVQADWLRREDPDYLLTYPSNALALAGHFARGGAPLTRLREVRTLGEPLTPAIRAACRRAWGVPMSDAYSSQECGYIALQCPDHEHYHVQSESVLVEILDEADRPCAPGAVGRVVVTPLHNFASVLLRYELGDYAEAGEPCPCGRGLPVIARVMGRYRNHVVLPDGSSYWPWLDEVAMRRAAPIGQAQVVQTSLAEVELRYTAARDLDAAEQQALAAVLAGCIGHPFRVAFRRLPAIPRSAGGKFEDFICEVPRRG